MNTFPHKTIKKQQNRNKNRIKVAPITTSVEVWYIVAACAQVPQNQRPFHHSLKLSGAAKLYFFKQTFPQALKELTNKLSKRMVH